jgi:hypothetical protein
LHKLVANQIQSRRGIAPRDLDLNGWWLSCHGHSASGAARRIDDFETFYRRYPEHCIAAVIVPRTEQATREQVAE